MLPPLPSHFMSSMDRFACAIEAQLIVTQREHPDDLCDRRNTATDCSHVNDVVERVARVASSTVDSAIEERNAVRATLICCLSDQLVS